MGKKDKKKEDKAAMALAARQEQKDKEREKIRQRMKERMRESSEESEALSPVRAQTPSESAPSLTHEESDSGDDKNEPKEEKKERSSEDEEDSSSVGVSPNKSQAKNDDGETGVTWGSGPAPPVSPRAPPRRKSLPLAQTRDSREPLKSSSSSPKRGAQDTIEKLLERGSGGPSRGGGHTALEVARGDRNSSRENSARGISPFKDRPKKKGKDKVSPNKTSPRDEEREQEIFLAEALLREETGKNIDQLNELNWY